MRALLSIPLPKGERHRLLDRIFETVQEEHGRFYGLPCGAGRRIDPPAEVHLDQDLHVGEARIKAGPLLDIQEHPGSVEGGDVLGWITSAGNLLLVWEEDDHLVILAQGRRHGIPWWILGDDWDWDEAFEEGLAWTYLETQRADLAPWETAT